MCIRDRSHSCLLEWRCPSCSAVRRGVFDNRASAHFGPVSCHACGYDFATTPAVAATSDQVATQERVDELAADGFGWGRFEDAVRCLIAGSGDGDAGRYLSPSGLPLASKVTLSVADRALDALKTSEAFKELLFSSMGKAVELSRSGAKVVPDVRPVMRRYVHAKGSRRHPSIDPTAGKSALKSEAFRSIGSVGDRG